GGHGVQQALLVAEDAVDRRGLHAGRRGDGAGGDRFAAALGQQLGGGFDDPVPVGLRHTATVTVPVLSVVPVEAGQLPGGVAQAGRGSGGDGLLDGGQLLLGELDLAGGEGLGQPVPGAGADERHDVLALGGDPGDGGLCGGDALVLGDAAQGVGQRQVVAQVLALEAGAVGAEVVGGE